MAKNYVQDGRTLNYTAGANIKVHVCGVFSVPKASGAITQGAKLYWSTTNSNLTTTASGNTFVGLAAEAAASGDASVKILLNVG